MSLMTKILKKIHDDQARAVVIVPVWKTQPWWPRMTQLFMNQPIELPHRKHLLKLPCSPDKIHPLWPKLKMMACLLSGRDCDPKVSLQETKGLFCVHGDLAPKKQYEVYLLKWEQFSEQNNVDPCSPLTADVLNFLTYLFDFGLGYSALNTAKSALSAVLVISDSSTTVGKNPLVQRFIKAFFFSLAIVCLGTAKHGM